MSPNTSVWVSPSKWQHLVISILVNDVKCVHLYKRIPHLFGAMYWYKYYIADIGIHCLKKKIFAGDIQLFHHSITFWHKIYPILCTRMNACNSNVLLLSKKKKKENTDLRIYVFITLTLSQPSVLNNNLTYYLD